MKIHCATGSWVHVPGDQVLGIWVVLTGYIITHPVKTILRTKLCRLLSRIRLKGAMEDVA